MTAQGPVEQLADDWQKAYSEDLFSEPPDRPTDDALLAWVDPETGEALSDPFPIDCISASMGRFMAGVLRSKLDDADPEEWVDELIDRLIGEGELEGLPRWAHAAVCAELQHRMESTRSGDIYAFDAGLREEGEEAVRYIELTRS